MAFFHSSQSYTLSLKGGKLYGYSVKNNYTFVIVPKMKIGFDIGICVKEHQGIDHLLISSLMPDRIGGLYNFLRSSERGCRILIEERNVPVLIEEIELLQKKYEVQDLLSDRFQIIGLKENTPFEINKNRYVKVIFGSGFTILEKKSKMRPEYIEEFRKVKNKKKYIEDVGREKIFQEKEETLWSYFNSLGRKEFPQAMLEAKEYVITSVPSFGHSMEFYEESTDEFTKTMIEVRDRFKGKGILFCDLEDYLCLSGNVNYFFFLLPHIPKENVEKVSLIPYSDLTRYKKSTLCMTDFQIDFERLKESRIDYPEYEHKTYPLEQFEFRQHLGYAGKRKFKMKQELAKKYGTEYTKAYLYFNDEQDNLKIYIDRDYALMLYEESYLQFLKKHRRVFEFICSEGIDVYDTEKENIYSGYDYHKQDEKKPTHLQDIAVRRCVKRLGGEFRGNRLLRIRGIDSELYCLNPGFVEFVKREWICRDQLFVRDWTLDGSVECFWQSNKVILTEK